MIYEDLRSIHEDIERLEQAVADRILDEPKHVSISRNRLTATELTTHRSVADSSATMKSQISSSAFRPSRKRRLRSTTASKMPASRRSKP